VTPFIAAKIQTLLKMDWATIYYHQHRIAHLPVVYDQSHKFHHYLHDTTPFDAHIYGAGKFHFNSNPRQLAHFLCSSVWYIMRTIKPCLFLN